MINEELFSYSFTKEEFMALAKFIRNNQDDIPVDLIKFSTIIEQKIYQTMSIEEVQAFYS